MASAAANMRSLADDLPPDAQAIQRAKRSEFHSLGLVLGYSYAGSPVIQPASGPAAAAASADLTDYTVAAAASADLTDYTAAAAVGGPDGLHAGHHSGGPAAAPLAARWLVPVRPARGRVNPDRQAGDGAAGDGRPACGLASQARRRGIPLTVVQAPPSYPWGQQYLLVRPDQHIAWRAADAAEIDLDVITGAAI